MKKYIALILAVLLIPSVAFSAGITDRLRAVVAAKNGGGGAPPAEGCSGEEDICVMEDGGGDYTTLAAALAAADPGDRIEIAGEWDSADSGGAVEIVDANLTIRAVGDAKHPGHAQGTPSHYRLYDTSDTGDAAILVSASGVTIDGLDIGVHNTGTSDEGVRMAADGGTLTVKNCLIWANSNSSDQDGVHIPNISATINVENCMIWGFGRGGVSAQPSTASAGKTQTLNINSCTIWNCGLYSGEAYGGGIACYSASGNTINYYVYNSIVVGNNTGVNKDLNAEWSAGTNNLTVDRSTYEEVSPQSDLAWESRTLTDCLEGYAPTDTDTPGDGDWIVFNDITSAIPDLRLKANAENSAVDVHTDSSGPNSMSMPSTDIVGTSRPQNTNYDVGAFEIVAE